MSPNEIKDIIISVLTTLEDPLPVLPDQAGLQQLLQYPKGSISVVYNGSSYESGFYLHSVSQKRTANFTITVYYRSLFQLDLTIEIIEGIKNLLRGLPINPKPDRLMPVNDELNIYNEKEGILRHSISFEVCWQEFQNYQ